MRWFFLLLFSSLVCMAAEPLSLSQALERVRQNNLELSIASLDEEISRLEHTIAEGQSWGTLDLTQTALRSNDALSVFGFKLQSREATFGDFGFGALPYPLDSSVVSIQPNDLNYPKTQNHFQTALEYTIPLYTGGKIEAHQKIAHALKVLKTLNKEELVLQKQFEVKKTFHTLSLLHYHRAQLLIIASNVSKMEQMTQGMLEEGYAKNVDLLEVQARKSDVERLIHQSDANQKLLFHFLSFLLQAPIESIVWVDEDVAFAGQSEEKLLESNVAIQKALKGVDISKIQIDLAQSAFLPQVGAFASYGSSDDTFLNDFTDKQSYTLGLQMRWNILRGGVDKNTLEKSRVEHLKAQLQLRLAQEGTLLQWRKLKTQIDNDSFEIESLKKELALAEAIYENYAGRYREKLVSIHEVLLKQSDEIGKRLKLRELQNRRNEKIFELETLISKDIP